MMIFCFHFRKFWVSHLPIICGRILNEFHIGVSIFFVLSGFLIAYTYKEKPLSSSKGYVQYILIRFARIFPVYLLILTCKYLSYGFPPFKETFLNYTLLKGFSDKYNLAGIPQAWSLTVELTFYCFAPLIYSMAKDKIFKPIIYVAGVLVVLFAMGYSLHLAGYNRDRYLYNFQFLLDATFFGRFFEFYVGILLAFVIEKRGKDLIAQPGIKATIGGLIGMILTCTLIGLFAPDIFSPGTNNLAGVIIRNLLLPVFIFIMIYGLITEINWFQILLSSRVFMILGNASYIFYLMHLNFGYFVLAKIKVFYDLNFTFLWLVSIAGYFLFEKPMYDFLKKKIND